MRRPGWTRRTACSGLTSKRCAPSHGSVCRGGATDAALRRRAPVLGHGCWSARALIVYDGRGKIPHIPHAKLEFGQFCNEPLVSISHSLVVSRQSTVAFRRIHTFPAARRENLDIIFTSPSYSAVVLFLRNAWLDSGYVLLSFQGAFGRFVHFFYVKGNSCGLRFTQNGEVCTEDASVAFLTDPRSLGRCCLKSCLRRSLVDFLGGLDGQELLVVEGSGGVAGTPGV